jgi:hypothetical protein
MTANQCNRAPRGPLCRSSAGPAWSGQRKREMKVDRRCPWADDLSRGVIGRPVATACFDMNRGPWSIVNWTDGAVRRSLWSLFEKMRVGSACCPYLTRTDGVSKRARAKETPLLPRHIHRGSSGKGFQKKLRNGVDSKPRLRSALECFLPVASPCRVARRGHLAAHAQFPSRGIHTLGTNRGGGRGWPGQQGE